MAHWHKDITVNWDNFSPSTLTFSDVQTETDAVKKLREHLQAAVSLELKTIPLYLYAAYSIKKPGPASWSIMNLVKQEMLHLALSGNILCSIGETPKLYRKRLLPPWDHTYVPEYPEEMPYQDITLNLDSANKRNIRTFMELERPEFGLNLIDEADIRNSEIHASIGSFYKAIALELSRWDASANLFDPKTINRQFSYEDGSWYDKSMIVVKDINSAQEAITTIVDQGEGSTTSPPRPELPTGRVFEPIPPLPIRSHFQVFEDLYNGPKLDHYTFVKNPKTIDLINHRAHSVLLACDAAYCYLLISIEKVWDPSVGATMRSELVTNNIRNTMSKVLRPLATFLTKEVYEKDSITHRLAPFFNFYQFESTTSCHAQLLKKMEDAAERFPELDGIKKVVAKLVVVNYHDWPELL